MEKKKGFVNENGLYELSEYEKARIMYGREQYEKGYLISNTDIEIEIDEWLNSEKGLLK